MPTSLGSYGYNFGKIRLHLCKDVATTLLQCSLIFMLLAGQKKIPQAIAGF
jgi:hypothetical protein